MPTASSHGQHGQVLVLFALSLTALILGTAVVVDGGFAFAQRRSTQNAADFAALAGTRIVGMAKIGQTAGTATNVRNAISETLVANDATLVSAQYVDREGTAVGDVFTVGRIPSRAFGVVVEARSDWQPFLLGVIGVTDWAASARATARTPGDALEGNVVPVAIEDGRFEELDSCELTAINDCMIQPLTPGELIEPGQFGWLAFGNTGSPKCNWEGVSLGMDEAGCGTSQQFLEHQFGPPPVTYGCCDEVGNSVDMIAGLPGNKPVGLQAYVDGNVPVWVPIYDYSIGPGNANSKYHIVGFGLLQFTGKETQHAKWLTGKTLEVQCGGYAVEGKPWCTKPLDAVIYGATGEVQLVN